MFCVCFDVCIWFGFFVFLCHTEQGDGKAGQTGTQAPLQETGHHLRAEDWGPEISCEHLQCNACKSGMRGSHSQQHPLMEQLYICQWVFLPRLRFLLQINLRSILQPWLTFCAWEGVAGVLSPAGFVLPKAWLPDGHLCLGWHSIQQSLPGDLRAGTSVFRDKKQHFLLQDESCVI